MLRLIMFLGEAAPVFASRCVYRFETLTMADARYPALLNMALERMLH